MQLENKLVFLAKSSTRNEVKKQIAEIKSEKVEAPKEFNNYNQNIEIETIIKLLNNKIEKSYLLNKLTNPKSNIPNSLNTSRDLFNFKDRNRNSLICPYQNISLYPQVNRNKPLPKSKQMDLEENKNMKFKNHQNKNSFSNKNHPKLNCEEKSISSVYSFNSSYFLDKPSNYPNKINMKENEKVKEKEKEVKKSKLTNCGTKKFINNHNDYHTKTPNENDISSIFKKEGVKKVNEMNNIACNQKPNSNVSKKDANLKNISNWNDTDKENCSLKANLLLKTQNNNIKKNLASKKNHFIEVKKLI